MLLDVGAFVQLLDGHKLLGGVTYHAAVDDGVVLGSIVVDKLFAAFEVSLGPGEGLFFEV